MTNVYFPIDLCVYEGPFSLRLFVDLCECLRRVSDKQRITVHIIFAENFVRSNPRVVLVTIVAIFLVRCRILLVRIKQSQYESLQGRISTLDELQGVILDKINYTGN